jgi:Rad3-related DNA helicase
VADLAAGGSVLGPYAVVVVDEAHALEDTAIDGFGGACWPAELDRRLQQIGAAAPGRPELRAQLREVGGAGASLWDAVASAAAGLAGSSPEGTARRLRFTGGDRFQSMWSTEAHALAGKAGELVQGVRKESARLAGMGEEQAQAAAELEGLAAMLEEWHRRLEGFAVGDDEQSVLWCEQRRDRWGLVAAPIEVSDLLAELLFDAVETAVCCSATLTVAGSFEFFRTRTGVTASGRALESRYGSPFPLEQQVKAVVVSYLSAPRSEQFHRDVAHTVATASRVLGRGPLVLFTAHSLLRRSLSTLWELMGDTPVLAQGISGSRTGLRDLFSESREAILLGSDSFWEGVDLPGEALECLVMTKLPFAVPTDPLVQAQTERIEAGGGSSFDGYMVPKAAVKLRQGIGRLIRTRNDKGVAILLDRRLLTARYGQVFLDSLPVKPVVARNEEELITVLKAWKKTAGWE